MSPSENCIARNIEECRNKFYYAEIIQLYNTHILEYTVNAYLLSFFYRCYRLSYLITLSLNYSCEIMACVMRKDSKQNIIYKKCFFLFLEQSKMENRLQGKAPEEDVVGQLQQNNKRPSMSLSMGGLWDVVPRLDHYRYFYKLLKVLQCTAYIKLITYYS